MPYPWQLIQIRIKRIQQLCSMDTPQKQKHTRLQVLTSPEDNDGDELRSEVDPDQIIGRIEISRDEFKRESPREDSIQNTPLANQKLRKELADSALKPFYPTAEPQTPDTEMATRRTQHITQQRLQFPQGSCQDTRQCASAQRTEKSQFEICSNQVRTSMDQASRSKEFTPRRIFQRKEFADEKVREPSYQFQERAIPLVSVSSSGKFELNQEVVQMMQHVRAPIGVVAVAGMYRTGKSYLLNRLLLNRKRGFNVGPTINPCTKGIWIWGTPLKSFTSTGEPCSVLIVDSEGIGGLDEDNNHDMRIFSLALLISSYFIYNSMSQIDENALQNLSLVVNLTKHIQTQAGAGLDQESGADLDAYLPTFMWVIRDFALQLEDDSGRTITDKDYLELALEQKGSSKTEAKNQIRAALLRHFKRRDCCTMVRPLVNEEQLQRLEEMDIEELRGQFVEQVVNLRKKVLGKIPVKKMKGTPMDGQTWIGLLKLYTQAFNEDRIPNVDSSWSYICRQRAEQSLLKATDYFESTLQDLTVPMSHDEMQLYLDESRVTSVQVFQQSLLEPTIAKDVLQRLQDWIQDRIHELLQQNEQACCEYAEAMLGQLFSEIVEQLRSLHSEPQFQQHVEYELGRLSQFYEAQCCQFPDKRLYLIEAKYSFMNDMLAEQVKYHQAETRLTQELEHQTRQNYTSQLQSLTDEHYQRQSNFEQQLRASQSTRAEVQSQLAIVQEQLSSAQSQHKAELDQLAHRLTEVTQDLAEKERAIQGLGDRYEDEIKELQRAQRQQQSQHEKSEALKEQKIAFLEQSIAERQSQDMNLLAQQVVKNDELQSELKQLQSHYEQKLSQLQSQHDTLLDHSQDLDHKLQHTLAQLTQSNLKCQDLELAYTSQIKSLQSQLQTQQQKPSTSQTNNQLQQSLQSQILSLEQKLKQEQDQQSTQRHDFKKQLAIKEQQAEFLSMQLQEMKEVLQATQSQHSQLMKMLHSQQSDSPKKLQQHSDSVVGELELQCDQLNSQLLQVSQVKEQALADLLSAQGQLQQAQSQNERLQMVVQQAREEFDLEIKTWQERVMAKERELRAAEKLQVERQTQWELAQQVQVESIQAQHQKEVEQCEARYSEQVLQLKQWFESERSNQEQRIIDEKERYQRRCDQLHHDHQQKYEEDLFQLQQELDHAQKNLQIQQQDALQKHQLLQAQLDHEKQLCHKLEQQAYQLHSAQSLQEQERFKQNDARLQLFEQQRQELQEKVDGLLAQLIDKDKQLACNENLAQRERDTALRSVQALSEQHKQAVAREEQLQSKYSDQKRRLQDLIDELQQVRSDSQQQQALLQQQNQFQAQQIKDLQQQNSELLLKGDEKISKCRAEVLAECAAQVQTIKDASKASEIKNEQKRLKWREQESALQAQITSLQAQLQTQLHSIKLLEERLVQTQESTVQNEQAQLPEEATLALKQRLQQLENELQDCQSEFDRDRALWQGKCEFLEQRKEAYKNDLQEQQKGFEMTLQQLYRRQQQDRDKQENQQAQLQKVLETKYKAQIREIVAANQVLQQEQCQKLKRLETELANVNQAFNNSNSSQQQIDERKLVELQQQLQMVQAELQVEKSDRQHRAQEYQRQLDKEKEQHRSYKAEMQLKVKELEQKKASLFFQVEKERATWLVEEEQLQRRCAEMEEQIQQLERAKETLKRDCEKIKRSDSAQRFTMSQGLLKQYDSFQTQGQGTTSSQVLGLAKLKKVGVDKKDLTLPLPQKAHSNRYKIQQHVNSTDTGEYLD